jgi:hypothetical protein
MRRVSASPHGFALVMAGMSAWFIFAVGLMAPLTPSEGMPSVAAVVVFVGLPLGLLAVVAGKARTGFVRAAAVVQGSVIVTITMWLLGALARWW